MVDRRGGPGPRPPARRHLAGERRLGHAAEAFPLEQRASGVGNYKTADTYSLGCLATRIAAQPSGRSTL